ncbi:MAG: ABC transporter permease subunit, partial [Candidatus Bathyarchaeota archaeon]|nr:ABC transporter permease subunit [Candidatus Bathyarchaeota archaeon]
GANGMSIILEHILPNSLGAIMIQMAYNVAAAITSVASLGFLGLGAQPPTPDWGTMLFEARAYTRLAPHTVIFPGIFILLFCLLANVVGESLRDAFDVKAHV